MFRLFDGKESPRVLLIDDEPVARLTARAALEQAGFTVTEAEDGESGLALFKTGKHDLVLLDVMMPKVDGYTVCSRIRAKTSGIYVPIIMMTGLDDIDSVNHAYQVGATDFITKPINPQLLAQRLRYVYRMKLTGDELRASEARLLRAQRIARLAHWEWDLGDDRLTWPEQVTSLLNIVDVSVISTYQGLFSQINDADKRRFECTINEAKKLCKSFALECGFKAGDETQTIYLESEYVSGPDGGVGRYIGTLQDVTERRRAEQRIKYLANYDKVTGLPNRGLARRILSNTVVQAQTDGNIISVLNLDIDNFKPINDMFGHRYGDEFLRSLAERLSEYIKSLENRRVVHTNSATLAHFGGDEFVVILTSLDVEQVSVVANEIVSVTQQPFFIKDKEARVNASIGISVYPEDGIDADALLRHAGAALHHAMGEGRNCYKFFTASMNVRALQRLSMETNLRRALENNQFVLYYQPKLCIRSNEIAGVEALVRWQHPDLGNVSPGEFIPLAEETGLITPLGDWILDAACRQAKIWQSAGLCPLKVAVNLSAGQFLHQDLPLRVLRALEQAELAPSFLEFEITESMLMRNIESAISTLTKLKDIGVNLSIDDFGTGYSSLAYLKRFPITTLKVDRSFIRDITVDADDAAIVSAVIAMAHKLRLKVVAEGVEKPEQFDFLKERACDQIQGYLLGRPMPPAQLERWLYSRREASPDWLLAS